LVLWDDSWGTWIVGLPFILSLNSMIVLVDW
jgi:hypothetical protein